MKKPKIVTLKQEGHINIDKIRMYAEFLIEKFPDQFKNFQEMDKYRIFFPVNTIENRARILFFRYQLVTAIFGAFGNRVRLRDIGLVLRWDSHSGCIRAMKRARVIDPGSVDVLKQELIKLHELVGDTPSNITTSHVLISGFVNNEEYRCFVPKEYFELATNIFDAIEQETGIKKDDLCAQGRGSIDATLARDVFVFIFCRKFPDVTEKFLAHILGRARHSTIAHSFYRQHDYQHPVIQGNDETKKFFTLVENVKKRCNVA